MSGPLKKLDYYIKIKNHAKNQFFTRRPVASFTVDSINICMNPIRPGLSKQNSYKAVQIHRMTRHYRDFKSFYRVYQIKQTRQGHYQNFFIGCKRNSFKKKVELGTSAFLDSVDYGIFIFA